MIIVIMVIAMASVMIVVVVVGTVVPRWEVRSLLIIAPIVRSVVFVLVLAPRMGRLSGLYLISRGVIGALGVVEPCIWRQPRVGVVT